MKVVQLGGKSAHLENEEGKNIGPVMLSKELVELLKIGDVMNITIGKFGKSWRVLESGNVYPKGALL